MHLLELKLLQEATGLTFLKKLEVDEGKTGLTFNPEEERIYARYHISRGTFSHAYTPLPCTLPNPVCIQPTPPHPQLSPSRLGCLKVIAAASSPLCMVTPVPGGASGGACAGGQGGPGAR